jgi:hypothetical protein
VTLDQSGVVVERLDGSDDVPCAIMKRGRADTDRFAMAVLVVQIGMNFPLLTVPDRVEQRAHARAQDRPGLIAMIEDVVRAATAY